MHEKRRKDDGDSDDRWKPKKRVKHKKVQPRIRCQDGFEMSVQASRDHCCIPRDDLGPYTHVEVGYTSDWEDELIPYRDRSEPVICGMRPTLYVNVPAGVVRAVVDKHGGMIRGRGGGRLPRLVEVGADGIQWAEAVVPPSTSESETEDTDRRSPHSTIHLGAPPPSPPPPPVTTTTTAAAATGELTPPPQLMTAIMSPIELTHERFNDEDIE